MNNEQILKKAIEKQRKDPSDIKHWLKDKHYYRLIFSHEFAKAFWGDKYIDELDDAYPTKCSGGYDYHSYSGYDWEYHLQQMVLEEEPLKYIEKFL